jgi:hypothetical protein
VLGVLMLRSVKYKIVYAGVGALVLAASIPFLPQSFTDRMSTIGNYQGDQSASTRVQVWKWTLDYVKDRPFGGGFEAYLGQQLHLRDQEGGRRRAQRHHRRHPGHRQGARLSQLVLRDARRAGLAGAVPVAVAAGARRLADGAAALALCKEGGTGRKSWQWGLATALQQAQVVYLVGSLFVGIAFQPFLFMLVGMQCALWSYVRRTEHVPQQGDLSSGPAKRKRCLPRPSARSRESSPRPPGRSARATCCR